MRKIYIVLILLLACQSKSHYEQEFDANGNLVRKCSDLKCIEFYENDQVKARYDMKDGRIDGDHLEFYADSSKRVSKYVKDTLHGESRLYYPNGKIRAIENYRNGFLAGEFRLFDSLGRLRRRSYLLNIMKEMRDTQEEVVFGANGDTVFSSAEIIEYTLPEIIDSEYRDSLVIDYRKYKLSNFMVITSDERGFDGHFFVRDASQLDTAFTKSSNMKVPLPEYSRGEHVIRGMVMNFDTVTTVGDTSVVMDHVDRYFEFSYEVL